MPGHIIPLRGSWESMPGEPSRHTRKFGQPRLPRGTERVWLICDRIPAGSEAILNGVPVGNASHTSGSFSADITDSLQPRNSIEFAVPSGEQIGNVTIEIRE